MVAVPVIFRRARRSSLSTQSSSPKKSPRTASWGWWLIPGGQLRARGVSAGKVPAKVKAERRAVLTHRHDHIPHVRRQNQAASAHFPATGVGDRVGSRIDNRRGVPHNCSHSGRSSAWLERVVWVHEVASSNLVAPTSFRHASLPTTPLPRPCKRVCVRKPDGKQEGKLIALACAKQSSASPTRQ